MHKSLVEAAFKEIRKYVRFLELTSMEDQQTLAKRLQLLDASVHKALQGMTIPDSYDPQDAAGIDKVQ